MLSSEHSLLPQRALVPAAADVVAVADVVVVAQRVVELPLHQQVVQQHRPERRQQTRGVDVVVAVPAAVADVVVVAVMPFPRFVDLQLNRGFRSSRGQPRSTTTTRRMR
jgi:tRNA A22 N-methylase